MKQSMTILYKVHNSLYVNLTRKNNVVKYVKN